MRRSFKSNTVAYVLLIVIAILWILPVLRQIAKCAVLSMNVTVDF